MAFFSFFSRKPNTPKPQRRRANLGVESLEVRATPANISGFVYSDINNNGIFDSGETPIANVSVQLKNANNQLVATAITNAQGFHEFSNDNTVSVTPTSISKVVEFPDTDTNFELSGLVDQFDPSLGQLQSIDIIHEGSITSNIKVENTSRSSGSTITGTVSGSLTLKAPGVNDVLNISQNAGNITVGAYDNNSDYGGTSGTNFGAKTGTGTNTTTVTGSALDAWKGTGKVSIQEVGNATSSATGGGNLATLIASTGKSKITVRYNYTPTNSLKPGTYVVTETQPASYLDGTDARLGVPLANSVGTDSITLNLLDSNLPNNNFGELLPAQINGYAYHDANNNGLKEANETPISGVVVTLSGTNDQGAASGATTTDANGFYKFENLRPGTYTVSETQPSQYNDGKDTAGTMGLSAQSNGVAGQNGTATNDQIASIVLPAGATNSSNNFGELLNASLAGYVYVDANNNGVKDGGEAPISGVVITLTGFPTNENPVSLTATTDATGLYTFSNLKPGSYALVEGTPGSQYLDGKDTIGTPGGTTANDNFSNITLASGTNGVNNNFGELLPAKIAGIVYFDENKNGTKDAAETGISGVTVTLNYTDDVGVLSRTATTNASGQYSFENLRPGTYKITETQPANYTDGQETLGNQGGTVGADMFSSITLAMGAIGDGYNFGEIINENADVGIVKKAGATQVYVGDTLTYTLTITNYGTFTAKGVTVTDTLPSGSTLLSTSGAGWTFSNTNSIVTGTLPTLAVGASAVITVQIRVPAVANLLTNTSSVTATTPDSNPLNNSSTVTTPVLVRGGGSSPFRTNGGNQEVIPGKYAFLEITANQTTPTVNNANATFVDGVFQTLLNRSVDKATQDALVAQLDNGLSRQALIQSIYNSDEHRGLQANAIYNYTLGRNPTATERQQTLASLKAGTNAEGVIRQLMNSAEYQTLVGTGANLYGNLYLTLTGTLPTVTQSQAGVQSMANSTVGDVVQSVQQSDDAYRSIIKSSHLTILRRDATEAEINDLLPFMRNSSLDKAKLMVFLLKSNEFFNLAYNSRV